MTASIHTAAFLPLRSAVSGMVHVALSLKQGYTMSLFRSCLRRTIRERLLLRFGTCPSDAISHKAHILRFFCARGPDMPARRALLMLLGNGDWRNSLVVEHYVGDSILSKYSEPVIRAIIEVGLAKALCPSKPRVYPQSRWTGADLTCDELGVMLSFHGYCLMLTTNSSQL